MGDSIAATAFGLEKFPLKIGNIAIPCFILENKKQIVLKSAVSKALGYDGKSETWLAELLGHINRFFPVEELIEQYTAAIAFELKQPGQPSRSEHGIGPITFLNVCSALQRAKNEGYLNAGQVKYSKYADKILLELNLSNFEFLIDEATGFNFYKAQAIDQLQRFYIQQFDDGAFLWLSTFPESFFAKLFEIHQTDWTSLKNQPQQVGKIIHEIIFSRIPDETLQVLRNTKPKRSYRRKDNSKRETIHPFLKEYLSNVSALIKAAGDSWNIFLQLLHRSFPKNKSIGKFPLLSEQIQDRELSSFNKKLLDMS